VVSTVLHVSVAAFAIVPLWRHHPWCSMFKVLCRVDDDDVITNLCKKCTLHRLDIFNDNIYFASFTLKYRFLGVKIGSKVY